VSELTNPVCQFATRNPYLTIAGIALTGLVVKCGFDVTSQTLYQGYEFAKRWTPKAVKNNLPLATGLALGGFAFMALKNAQ
jgi:hypothetical protein